MRLRKSVVPPGLYCIIGQIIVVQAIDRIYETWFFAPGVVPRVRVTSQFKLLWRHNAKSEKIVLDKNDEISNRWLF